MPKCRLVALALIFTLALPSIASAAAPKKPAPKAPTVIAPNDVPHAMALFLASLSGDGKRRVTYKATALGTRFFFEEAAGVTVYTFDGTAYRKTTFLKGTTLDAAVKKTTKADAAKPKT